MLVNNVGRSAGLSVSCLVFTVSLFSAAWANDVLYDKRFKRLKENASAGDARAQYKLGLCYMKGENVKVDLDQAARWFKKAAVQGNIKAAHRLGSSYYNKRNYAQAFKWFSKAAKKQHPVAQYYLAMMYKDGKGTRRDSGYALLWANRAKNNGIQRAQKLIRSIQKSAKKKPGIKKKDSGELAKKDTKPKDIEKIRTTLLSAKWNTPNHVVESKIMESLRTCIKGAKKLRCKSGRIKTENKNYSADFLVESILYDFKPSGKFRVRYRTNYVFVLPADPDDPNPNYFIPSMGPEKEKTLECSLVSSKRIKCLTKDRKTIVYSKK